MPSRLPFGGSGHVVGLCPELSAYSSFQGELMALQTNYILMTPMCVSCPASFLNGKLVISIFNLTSPGNVN